ncbi:MAG TPA: hypothetical protein VK358_04310 [Longimicrobium sp.]|nr:hypothetical protein [Longimicrobium sp.]
MIRSILFCTLLLAACGPDALDESAAGQSATEHGATMASDTSLEGTPMIGVVPEVRERARQAEADMAERARQAQEQAGQAEGTTPRP